MDVESIGRSIRELRRARNITQKELSNQLFMDSRTYSKIERGERKNIDIMTLWSIAKILNVDIMDLLVTDSERNDTTGPENRYKEQKDTQPVLNKLDTLSHEIGLLKEEIFKIKDAITHQNNVTR